MAQGFCCGSIGREEGLERKLRQRDVDGRAEYGSRADEAEHARFRDELNGHNDPAEFPFLRTLCGPGTTRHRILAKLAHELHEHRVGGDVDLMTQARE